MAPRNDRCPRCGGRIFVAHDEHYCLNCGALTIDSLPEPPKRPLEPVKAGR